MQIKKNYEVQFLINSMLKDEIFLKNIIERIKHRPN
jgi:hypothetical protein